MKNKKAVTLIELIIAIGLLGLIILSTTSIEMFARKQMKSTDIQTQLLNEVSPAMEYIVKTISLGIGDKNDPGVKIENNAFGLPILKIRKDIAKTPSDYTDDVWCGYVKAFPANNIIYYPDLSDPSNNETIAVNKIKAFTPEIPNPSNPNIVQIKITARNNPSQPVDPSTNPEISITTQVSLGSMSIS